PLTVDPLGNIRVQLRGKYGFNEDEMTHDFAGWLTHLRTKKLDLQHVLARFEPPQTGGANDGDSAQILNLYQIHDLEVLHSSDSSFSFYYLVFHGLLRISIYLPYFRGF